jgi:hypothetical protein
MKKQKMEKAALRRQEINSQQFRESQIRRERDESAKLALEQKNKTEYQASVDK